MGWTLHNNSCVGTVYRALCMSLEIIIYMYGKQTNDKMYICFDLFQTLMSVVPSKVSARQTASASIQRVPLNAEVSGLEFV